MTTVSLFEFNAQDYYQSERPTPPQYRHSQTDLTEWDENAHNEHSRNTQNNNHHHTNHQQRRSGPTTDRESSSAGYAYRNGSKDKDDWEDVDRSRREGRFVSNALLSSQNRNDINIVCLFFFRRSDGRFSETASVVSSAVLNHYASLHRRPINRVRFIGCV